MADTCTHKISCELCGKKFEAPKPIMTRNAQGYRPLDNYNSAMPRPVPKPSQTKKVRGKKTIDNIED